MDKLICLASQSASRKQLLTNAKIRFTTISADIDESLLDESPENYVKRLAEGKVNEVRKDTDADVIIGADSVAILGNKIIGKPTDLDDAKKIMMTLQNKTHSFITGLHVLDNQLSNSETQIVRSEITFSEMSKDEINRYVEAFKPLSYAGGYSIGFSGWFVESITGSFTNIMGLPLESLKQILSRLGHSWFDFVISD